MTIWQPDLSRASGPIYVAIADAIAREVDAGILSPGAKLPTHRELAEGLEVALTTVTRGYAEAERRGLVSGEVGRGTFVRGGAGREATTERGTAPALIDLTVNALLPYAHAAQLTASMARLLSREDPIRMLDYQPFQGDERQRTAGALWMERAGVAASPSRVLVTSGAQHAMAVALSTLANPGDVVLTERLTYSGMKSLANHLHVRLVGLAMDEHGLLPDALETACRQGGAKALYTMPTLHNPAGIVMPEERRAEIAAIADRFALPVLEDDSYGFLVPDVKPLATFSPNVYYLCGTSKSLAASLRIGFLLCPPDMVDRLTAAISSTTFMASPPMGAVVAEWIFDGTADRIMAWKRKEVAARREVAAAVLGRFDNTGHPMAQHLWLELPDPWRTDQFVSQARMRGVLVSPAEDFVVDRSPPPYAVRVTLGSVRTRDALKRGLTTLAEILDAPAEPCRAMA
ncbi:MAG: PLP-dependent aminotransferase family protein [Gemmatimonadetes bacterium]|nr:PLP-dependent aminotransferase family protein [Gemmatimonadota bacterium]